MPKVEPWHDTWDMTSEYTGNIIDSTSLKRVKVSKILALVDEGNFQQAIGKPLNEVEVDPG